MFKTPLGVQRWPSGVVILGDYQHPGSVPRHVPSLYKSRGQDSNDFCLTSKVRPRYFEPPRARLEAAGRAGEGAGAQERGRGGAPMLKDRGY